MTNRVSRTFPVWLIALLAVVGASLSVAGGLTATGVIVDRVLFGPPLPNEPVFSPTVMWGGHGKSLINADPADGKIVLLPGGHALLSDFPEGKTVTAKHGYVCFLRAGSTLFSGRATWAGTSAFDFQLKYGGSTATMNSDTDGYIGRTPDWDSVALDECGSDSPEWTFGYVCGRAGGGDAGKLDAVCRK